VKSIRNVWVLVTVGGAVAAVACAAQQPPRDLVSARSAYDRASAGPAAQLDPRELDTAKKQLAVAETSFKEDGDTQNTRDQAYLALRRAELAEVMGRTRQARQGETATILEMHADQERVVANTSAALGRAKAEVASQSATLNARELALANETARRQEAEKRAAQAAADLAKFASVKQETRGTVITLSGGVLFASGKSDLFPAALLKLNQVATALTREDPLSKIVVEGHTDSQGSSDSNMTLSKQRAQAVRSHLVARGIAADRVTAEGFGSTRSVADNGSPEGRANNRRVEIVILPEAE
jgi:outer membrane protein OmpA-like peptidoglycan-associated protein